jgi:hypothetical protein
MALPMAHDHGGSGRADLNLSLFLSLGLCLEFWIILMTFVTQIR